MLLDEMECQEVDAQTLPAPKSPLSFWSEATRNQKAIMVACVIGMIALLAMVQMNISAGSQRSQALTEYQSVVLK